MKRCGTSLHQEVLEKLLIEPLKDSANDFCDPKNMYRASKWTWTLVFDLLKPFLTNKQQFGRVFNTLSHSNDKTFYSNSFYLWYFDILLRDTNFFQSIKWP